MRWGLLLELGGLACFLGGLAVLLLPPVSDSPVSLSYQPPKTTEATLAFAVPATVAASATNAEQNIGLTSRANPNSTSRRSAASAKVKRGPAQVDINKASQPQLEALPGIGPVLSSSLIAARQKAGGFQCWSQVDAVPGIGKKTIERLEPWLMGLSNC